MHIDASLSFCYNPRRSFEARYLAADCARLSFCYNIPLRNVDALLLRIAAAYQTIAPHREVAAGFAGPLAR